MSGYGHVGAQCGESEVASSQALLVDTECSAYDNKTACAVGPTH